MQAETEDKMIEYLAVKENAENLPSETRNTYGICACEIRSGRLEVVRCTDAVSGNADWIKSLVMKLNKYSVDPVHLNDIIEDELYVLKA